MIGWITGNWIRLIPYIAILLGVFGAWAYIHHQTAQIEALQANLTQSRANTATAETAAHANAAALGVAIKQHAADMAAINKHYAAQAAINKAADRLLEYVNNAPETDDGPIAPVLLRALNGLCESTSNPLGASDYHCKTASSESASKLSAKP